MAAKAFAPDLIVPCGGPVTVPLSPPQLQESFDLVRAEGLPVVVGNHDLVLAAWGTPDWDRIFALRMARGYQPGPWVRFVGAGQAQLPSAELDWLRGLPEELTLAEGAFLTH